MSKLAVVTLVPDENQIKRAIIEYLTHKGALVLRVNSGAAMGEYQDKQGRTKKRFLRFAQWFGLGVSPKEGQAGISDILAVWQGVPVAIETKRPGNVPTPAQERFLAEWTLHGGMAIVAQSIDDVMKIIQ